MSILRLGLTAVGILLAVSGAGAQSAFARSATADPPKLGEGGGLDVSRLPIDLGRIQRKLQASSIREERRGLDLHYVVEVYGRAPAIVFFGPKDDMLHGPVPGTAPTHRDMIEHVTPREYRTPAADLGALARWLAERASK